MIRLTALLFAALLAASCAGVGPEPGFRSSDPIERVRALAEAIDATDHASIPELIAMLDADDPAVRMLAIRGLERLTGESRGFRWDDPQPQRDAAIEEWVRWWRSTGAARNADTVSGAAL